MMSSKEFTRLAKLSLNSRKKTTASTVRGIAFGLILLVPIIFLSLGITIDMSRKINSNPQLLYANVEMATERENLVDQTYQYDSKTYAWNESIVGSTHYEFFDAIDNPGVEKVYFETLINSALDFDRAGADRPKVSYKLGNDASTNASGYTEISPTSKTEGTTFKNFSLTSIVDLQKSNGIIAPTTYGDVYVENCDNGFTDNGKLEVILSEAFVKHLGYTAEEVMNKQFSITYFDKSSSVYIDDDTDPNNTVDIPVLRNYTARRYLFKNYLVVGVIKEEVTQAYFSATGDDHILGSSIILSDASAILPNGTRIEPKYTTRNIEGRGSVALGTYSMDQIELLNYEGDYITYGVNYFSNCKTSSVNSAIKYYSSEHIMLFADSYSTLYDVTADCGVELKNCFSDSQGTHTAFSNTFASTTFSNYRMIYQIFTYVSFILISIGGIIFFSAMVNLFNTIMHSVDTRKNYLGVMRAIGARDKVIPKLYIYETLTIFKRALIWVGIVGGALCVGLKLGIDYIFKLTSAGSVAISISWWYILITFGIVVVVLLTLGWSFAYGCSKNVARKPITHILEG